MRVQHKGIDHFAPTALRSTETTTQGSVLIRNEVLHGTPSVGDGVAVVLAVRLQTGDLKEAIRGGEELSGACGSKMMIELFDLTTS